MIEKTASVHWHGSGKHGLGEINTETGALEYCLYGRNEARQRGLKGRSTMHKAPLELVLTR